MREIKFRAWYKPENYMTYPTDIDLMAEMATVTTKEGWETGQYGYADCDIVLMQYTGLKDKNGVEIYEGDIVKYQLGKYKDPDGGYGPDNWEMFYETAEIVYDESKGRFKRKDRFHDFIDTPECEIIGNIHENPELLEGKE